MSILEKLDQKREWQNFLEYKKARNQLTLKETAELELFILEERYLEKLNPGIPEKKILSKIGSDKKRTVYCFDKDTTWKLKLLAHLLYCYDDRLSDSCYSFRRTVTASTAFSRIRKIKELDNKYVLKADISNYFNSIPVEKLLTVMRQNIDDDPELISFFEDLLRKKKCIFDGEVIDEETGAMAGVPLASFFANFYLKDMDIHFEKMNVDYFRYSDDILVFGDNEDDIHEYYRVLCSFLSEKGLRINEKKLKFYKPEDGFEFLGFRYQKGVIDLSDVTVSKMKGKISRKARSLVRKKRRRSYSFEKTAVMMIRCFDAKFYDLTGDNEYTWTRFYFPVISSSEGLKKIDEYMLENIRFLYSGRHYKGNYQISYEEIKKLGYTSLVHEYYTWKKDNRKLREINREL